MLRWTETYQVRAHVPVSRECTIETERFLHFQERRSSCFTSFGTGSRCSSRWTTLKSKEHTSTDEPGCLFSTGSRASILSPPPHRPLSSLPLGARYNPVWLPPFGPLLLAVQGPGKCLRGPGRTGTRGT